MKLSVWFCQLFLILLIGCGGGGGGGGEGVEAGIASQSGTIQISADDQFVFAINQIDSDEANTRFDRLSDLDGSLSIINVAGDVNVVDDEVTVGKDPRSVSVNVDRTTAFVSNGKDGTVSVIDLTLVPPQEIAEIVVGSEPRGTALTPNGDKLYVANYGDGSVSVIDTATNTVINTIRLEFDGNAEDPFVLANPFAISVSNDGDEDDDDETVLVADFFARGRQDLALDAREGFDDGKEGLVAVIESGSDTITVVTQFSPVENTGFTADRTNFDGTVFDGGNNDQQGAFFNQLHQIVLRTGTTRVYIPTIAASPEPPSQFDVNTQALVAVMELGSNAEVANEHFNINDQVQAEEPAIPPFDEGNVFRLQRAFSGDTVAMAINAEKVLFVSRSGAFVTRGFFVGDTVNFNFQDPEIRIPVGNMPNGIVMNSTGTRAYVNSEVAATTTVINLDDNTVLATVENANLPPVNTTEHQILIGKLAFYTGMGLAADGLLDDNVRDIDTHRFRNIAANSNWSSCGTCHPDGLSDGVTWIFATGPRQTIPLDGSFSFADPDNDRRAMNWNAIRGSVVDFNNNARNVQGGFGFTPDALRAVDSNQTADLVEDADEVFNHGPIENTVINGIAGVSDALSSMTLFVKKGIRTFSRSTDVDLGAAARGRLLFGDNCASCHGGAKWTSSQILWDQPLFDINGNQLDDDVTVVGADRSTLEVNVGGDIILIIQQNFDTFDVNNPIEVSSNGGGEVSLGQDVSFNPPSLLGVRHTGPFGHHGRADTLQEVFLTVAEDGLEHPDFGLDANQINDLVEFLKTIDEDEPPFVIVREK
ncbi:YncE family protein [Candidatus Uabimicrobium amorphum]|uniref:Cytochrome c domain-containing protein n=1 Tax=Uabimicrobium amorphum TaxID=2596890 RepID=A0A5S9IVD2_UABAM|nr:YncE family protein [Candidatus Uabimicrobium amorphum]BBM88286.1 hypothetical protein UABAM_06707 [Candidatus Uabimicrobium amorphum]